MPGIVGLITRMPRVRAEAELRRMLASMQHEPFYTSGTWMDDSLGVYLGWTSLEGAFSDGMPLVNEDGSVVLALSGEEFSRVDTAPALRQQGHRFDPNGPEYLVHIAEDDPSFPLALNGRFHGVLVERSRRKVTLFNDRFGMHRLYIHESPDGFFFAAEAKAILAVCPETRAIDPRGLGETVSCACVLENRTLFKGIQLLPGASRWIFCRGTLADRSTYFNPDEWEQQDPLTPEAYYQNIHDVFTARLPRYLESKQPISMSLTGGLDTRMIMAWQRQAPGALACYSFGGMLRDCEDVRQARRIAAMCHQPYHVITAGREFLAKFAHYAERTVYLTDGAVDVSLCPDLHIYEQSRRIGPVRMTGNWGGEILRRVRAFKPIAPEQGIFDGELMARVEQASVTYAGMAGASPVRFSAFLAAPWFNGSSLVLEQSQLTSRTPYLDNDLVRTSFRAPSEAAAHEVCRRLIQDGHPELARLRTDRGIGGGGGQLWTAARRAALEFSFKAEYAYDYGMPQWVAAIDHWLSPLHLERLFLGRHKMYHFRIWYRDQLADYIRDTLLTPSALSRPYLVPARVRKIVSDHVEGRRNYTKEIHKLLTFELTHRLFVDAHAA